MKMIEKRIVLANGVRTPFGNANKSLSDIRSTELATIAIRGAIEHSQLDPKEITGVLFGWVGQLSNAPNIARVAGMSAGLSERSVAFTLHVNCVSGIEAVASAARKIMVDEGDLFIAGGVESMSELPYTIRGARKYKGLKTLDDLRKHWHEIPDDPNIELGDTLLEGLRDPMKGMLMAETAELLAQVYDISRDEQDAYAVESYRRAIEAIHNKKWDEHMIPIIKDGVPILEQDENPILRENFVKKPEKAKKAITMFDNDNYSLRKFFELYQTDLAGKKYEEGKTKGTISPFNSCPRSDGAAAVIVATEARAKELGLDIIADISSWGFAGVNPAYMGMGPAFSAQNTLERGGFKFDQLDYIELHEAFAAGCLAIFKVGDERLGHSWHKKWKAGKLNPNGGSLAIGHPLGASGTRIIIQLAHDLRNDSKAKHGLAAACAAGGVSGAMILSRYEG